MPVSLGSGVGGEITLIDNEGNATTFTWTDSTNGWSKRLTTYPDAKAEAHSWDREGRLRRFVDGRGYQTVYRYDSLSRLVGVDYLTSTGATAATSLALSYDRLGRLSKTTQGTVTVDSATYDNLGRPLTSLQTVAATVYTLGYAYADAARTRTLTLPDGATIKQKWTARGLLDSLWSGSRLLARFGYSSGLETSRTLGNGIAAAQGFDAAGRPSSLAYTLTGQTLPSLGFAYDPYGNRALVRRNHATTTSEAIGYTNDNQISAWNKGTADASGAIASPTSSQSWTLDSRGNWSSWTQSGTAQTRTHSTANELTAMGGTALTWDAAGNLTSDGTLTYVFGARGTLDTVKQGATVNGIYGTDPLGRRALKTVGPLKTISIFDGWQCVWQKVTGSGTDTTKAFTYGNSIDREVSMIRKWGSSSDTVYALQGANENTEALTDRTGSVIERYEYTPYGKPTVYTGAGTDGKWFTSDDVSSTVSAKGNNVLFQGRELDAESGNYFYRARSYSPTLGRFISRDPVRSWNILVNVYRALMNSPFNRIDPTGQTSVDWGSIATKCADGADLAGCANIDWDFGSYDYKKSGSCYSATVHKGSMTATEYSARAGSKTIRDGVEYTMSADAARFVQAHESKHVKIARAIFASVQAKFKALEGCKVCCGKDGSDQGAKIASFLKGSTDELTSILTTQIEAQFNALDAEEKLMLDPASGMISTSGSYSTPSQKIDYSAIPKCPGGGE